MSQKNNLDGHKSLETKVHLSDSYPAEGVRHTGYEHQFLPTPDVPNQKNKTKCFYNHSTEIVMSS